MNEDPLSGIPPIPDVPPAAPLPGMPPVPPENTYLPPANPAADPGLSANDKTMGMISHLIAFAGIIIPIPFANVVGPLIFWVTQKDKSAYLDYHGKESLNFQITVAIAVAVSMVLMLILVGFLLLFAVGIYAIVMTIIAGIKAQEGVRYRYPYTLRLIK